jgi:hypothetical protein
MKHQNLKMAIFSVGLLHLFHKVWWLWFPEHVWIRRSTSLSALCSSSEKFSAIQYSRCIVVYAQKHIFFLRNTFSYLLRSLFLRPKDAPLGPSPTINTASNHTKIRTSELTRSDQQTIRTRRGVGAEVPTSELVRISYKRLLNTHTQGLCKVI